MNQSPPLVSRETEQNWFKAILLKYGQKVFARCAHYYIQLYGLPRQTRRYLRHTAGVTLTGLALALALSGAPAVQAANITVAGSCTLDEAVANANDNTTGQPYVDCTPGTPNGADTITLTGDVTLAGTLPVTSEIVLNGDDFTIDADGGPTIFDVASAASLTINRAILTGVDNTEEPLPGAIYNAGTLSVIESEISGNVSYYGGGIVNYGGTATVRNSLITGNRAYVGGGVYTRGVSNAPVADASEVAAVPSGVTIIQSVISNNYGYNAGGGLVNLNDHLTIENSIIAGNRAGRGGGVASAAFGGPIINASIDSRIGIGTLRAARITGETAAPTMSNGAYTIINNSIIAYNYAEYSGGGILNGSYNANAQVADLVINNSTITGNAAVYTGLDGPVPNSGGGIYNVKQTISGVMIPMDTRNAFPGAVTVTLNNSTISSNYAAYYGGGIANVERIIDINEPVPNVSRATSDDAVIELNNSTVTLNVAAVAGGGIYNSYYADGGILNDEREVAAPNSGNPTIDLNRTIISGNDSFNGPEIAAPFGTINGQNYNIIGYNGDNGIDSPFLATINVDPAETPLTPTLDQILDPVLTENGGPTPTHALVIGSPAVDQVPTGDSTAGIDQRGAVRDFDGDNFASPNEGDIGAVELRTIAENCGLIEGVDFTLNGITFNVTTLGDLACIKVEEMGNTDHLIGTDGMSSPWWHVYGEDAMGNRVTDGFNLSVTLPAATPDITSRVCKFPGQMGGAGWDCDDGTNTTFTPATSVTRANITSFSDFVVAQQVNPTAVTLQDNAAEATQTSNLPLWLSTLVLTLGSAWVGLKRRFKRE